MKNYVTRALLILFFVHLGCLCTAPAAESLPDGLHSLPAIDESLQDLALAPLDALVGDASVVGLGESIHTSGGFEAAKSRIARYMIEHLGFRAVTIESSWGEALAATRYVESCSGSPVEAIQSLFRVWQSDSLGHFLEWLCKYNRIHLQDPVKFYGFDIQQSVYDGHALREYFKALAPSSSLTHLIDGIQYCYGAKYDSKADFQASPEHGKPLDAALHAKCLTALDDVTHFFQGVSGEQVGWARLSVDSLRAFERSMFYFLSASPDLKTAFEARDAGMAKSFEQIKAFRFTKAKAILWAHDGHLAENFTAATVPGGTVWKNTGTILKEIYGEGYAAIGLTGYEVKTHWPDSPEATLSFPTEENSLELALHHLNTSNILIDTRSAWIQPGKVYEMFGGPGNSCLAVPAEQFRALVYSDTSAPMTYWPYP